MNKELINKVLERHQLHDALALLTKALNTSELTTFLQYVYATRAAGVNVATLRQPISQDRFVKPTTVSPRVFHRFDGIAFDILPGSYELIELSPLAPLGTGSALAAIDHGVVVNTIRSQDVVSDSTNVLALIAASRRHGLKIPERPEMDFCTTQRLVRAQLPQYKEHTAHFRIFTIVSAGRDRGSYEFEQRKLTEHIRYYIDLIRSFDASRDTEIEVLIKEYADTGMNWGALESEIAKFHVGFSHQRMSRENWTYYHPFQFNINIRLGGDLINLGDGGMVDWTQKLLSDKKERLLISGFGTELFCKLFLVGHSS